MESSTLAPSWFSEWADQARAAGAVVTRAPKGVLSNPWAWGADAEGALAANYPDGRWELAPLAVLIADAVDAVKAWFLDPTTTYTFSEGYKDGTAAGDKATGAVVTGAYNVAKSLVPWWVYLAGGVVAYGALVQAGILPPLNRLLKR